MITLPDSSRPILADLLLAVADDKLMLGHRNSDWTGLGPMLEEDIAFSSLAQDEIAHAQALYELAADLLGTSADRLAFGRRVEEYRCAAIVVGSDDFDWAVAICRQFLCSHHDRIRLDRLAASCHAPLAALAGRLAAEEQVQVEHVDGWVRRLGTGTEESRRRMQDAMDRLAPMAPMLVEPVADQDRLESSGVYPPLDRDLFDTWSSTVLDIARRAGLRLDLSRPSPDEIGGRRGRHTPDLETLLDEMCEVFRTEPEAAW